LLVIDVLPSSVSCGGGVGGHPTHDRERLVPVFFNRDGGEGAQSSRQENDVYSESAGHQLLFD
jgi:hypothetical protein